MEKLSLLDAFRLDFPPQWVAIPTDPDAVDAFLAASQIGPVLAAAKPHERRQVENFLRRLVAEMRSQACIGAAVYAELVLDDTEGAEPVDARVLESLPPESFDVISASCVVQHLSAASVESAATLTPDVLLAAMSMSDPATVQYRELAVPGFVELPAGNAVRLLRLYPDTGADGELYSETYMIPIAPEFEHVFVVQFSTPALDLTQEFSEVFRAIASTFAVFREGEPTPA